ncbi:hypothetical protein [Chondromyces apiculatus]|uniref:Uncharacterized protein n=1 Tax=Chondromyces apiculatus DSM 436 TaxID=1192034 RepID=A0A017SWV7_9BACT|nr:hypothetical protein [Chondromyces apiculatus]EYF01448.1 Hypothetical protein CAP_8281 [Chondromyces apiculatus DSM 436]
MQKRTRNLLGVLALLSLGTALGGALAYRARSWPFHDTTVSALDAIPGNALIAGTADLRALRASTLGAPFFHDGREIDGVGKIRELCGFDPLDQIDEIAFGVPPSDEGGELGLVASGKLQDDDLVRCATRVIEARGGQPVVTPMGSFRTVRDTSTPSGIELAIRPGGPVLLASGSYLRTMIDSADGRTPSVLQNPSHTEAARRVEGQAARITMVLTPEQRRQIAEEVASGGDPDAQRAPAASIQSAALGVALAENVGFHAVLTCASAPPCEAIGKFIERARDAHASDRGALVSLFASVLRNATIQAQADTLHLRLQAPTSSVAFIVEQLLTLRARRTAAPPPRDALPRDALPPEPPPHDQPSSAPRPPGSAVPGAAPATAGSASPSAPPPSETLRPPRSSATSATSAASAAPRQAP